MFLIIATIFLIFIILYFSHALKENLNHWKRRGVKYVKPAFPVVGNMLPIVSNKLSMAEFIHEIYNKFPKDRYFGIFQFLTPVLVVREPELIKQISIKNFENFVDHAGFVDAETDPLWGKNLFSSTGERWKDLRQTMSPVFTGSKMRSMFVLMDQSIKEFIQHFKTENKDIIEVEMKDVTSRLTIDVIGSTAFGINCNSMKMRDNEFYQYGCELMDTSGLKKLKFLLYGNIPRLSKFFGLKLVSDKIGNFFRALVDETLKLREEKNIIRPDLIHLLMLSRKGKLKFEATLEAEETGFAVAREVSAKKAENSSENVFLNNEEITAQAIVFFVGGFDTTSSLISFVSYELAANQKIQDKVRNEIKKVKENCTGRDISYEDIVKNKYLDMVISEALRKWPQAIWLDRKCTKTFEISPERDGENPVKVEVGDIVWFPTFGLHRDPKYYPDPERFDPERFSDENRDKIVQGTYVPFGIGPRNCIGSRFAILEAKVFLFHLLADFEIVATEKTKIPLTIDKNAIMLLSEGGFNLGLKRI